MELREVRSALLVVAHPDDIEAFCAGTAVSLVAQGARVAFLLLTSGDKGSADPLADPRQIAATREAEQRAAARVLGVDDLTFLRLPDGEVTDTLALRAAIAAQIRRVRPDLLITFDPWRPYAFHNDHRQTGFVALAAIVTAARPGPLPGESDRREPHQTRAAWLFNTESPDRFIDTGATLDTKIAARLAHASQTADPAALARNYRRRDAECGATAGLDHAEAFHEMIFEPVFPAVRPIPRSPRR